MSFLLDLTVDRPHFYPPARRNAGAGNIKFPDEVLAFGRLSNGTTFEKMFEAYQKSFVSQEKSERARTQAG